MRKVLALLAAVLMAGAAPLAAQQATIVILVRHAEKDVEPAGDPVLTAAGTARAQALADLLADRGVDGIIVTEYARTRLTAEPLAERLGLTPDVASVRGGMRAHTLGIVDLVRSRYAGRTVVVVGHSNTVPIIVTALGAPEVGEICEGAHSNLFVVTVPEGGPAAVERSTYGAADPSDPCAPQG